MSNKIDNYIMAASRGGDDTEIPLIRSQVATTKTQIDYNMNRFIDDFGNKLDKEVDDKYHRFAKNQAERYAQCTRLERVLIAYGF